MYRVKLEGLKIYVRRGKWWVYRRRTGEALVRGFDGDRAELDRKLASPDFLAIYNRRESPSERHRALTATR